MCANLRNYYVCCCTVIRSSSKPHKLNLGKLIVLEKNLFVGSRKHIFYELTMINRKFLVVIDLQFWYLSCKWRLAFKVGLVIYWLLIQWKFLLHYVCVFYNEATPHPPLPSHTNNCFLAPMIWVPTITCFTVITECVLW